MIARSAATVASRRWPAFRGLMIVWRIFIRFRKIRQRKPGTEFRITGHPTPGRGVVYRLRFGVRVISKSQMELWGRGLNEANIRLG
jgi:hypothetical protein